MSSISSNPASSEAFALRSNEAVSTPTTSRSANLTQCDFCNLPIRGDRFKCLDCPDFDTCMSCFRTTPQRHPFHGFVKIAKPEDYVVKNDSRRIMHYATCNGCRMQICGIRYKCMHPDCPDFDLCEDCEVYPIPIHPDDHPLLKLKTLMPNLSNTGGGMPPQAAITTEQERPQQPDVQNPYSNVNTHHSQQDDPSLFEKLFEETVEQNKIIRCITEAYVTATKCEICFENVQQQFIIQECGHSFCGICLRSTFEDELAPRLLAVPTLAYYGYPRFDCQAIPTSREHLDATVDGISQSMTIPEAIFTYTCPLCRGIVTRPPIVPFKFSQLVSSVQDALKSRLVDSSEYDLRDQDIGPNYFEGLFLND